MPAPKRNDAEEFESPYEEWWGKFQDKLNNDILAFDKEMCDIALRNPLKPIYRGD